MTESNDENLERLRYPIGRYHSPETIQQADLERWIAELAQLPGQLRDAVADLGEAQLQTPYRPNGWTVRQIVHHLPDSHMNSYIRFRLALTENQPSIKPYREAAWAELHDAKTAPVELSLALLESLHTRWIILLRSLQPSDFDRIFHHPEQGSITLADALGHYAWHGRYHVAQITALELHQQA